MPGPAELSSRVLTPGLAIPRVSLAIVAIPLFSMRRWGRCWAEKYGDQTEKDHAALLKAIRENKVKADLPRWKQTRNAKSSETGGGKGFSGGNRRGFQKCVTLVRTPGPI